MVASVEGVAVAVALGLAVGRAVGVAVGFVVGRALGVPEGFGRSDFVAAPVGEALGLGDGVAVTDLVAPRGGPESAYEAALPPARTNAVAKLTVRTSVFFINLTLFP